MLDKAIFVANNLSWVINWKIFPKMRKVCQIKFHLQMQGIL